MPRIILLQAGQAQPFELDRDELFLGRLPECEIQLPSNMISRKHARIFVDGSGFAIEDLNSGNGTFVNGQRITEATLLKHDDRIKIGPMLLRYETERSYASATPPQPKPKPQIELSADDSASAVMGSVENASGFGLTNVQPEAKLKAVLEISRGLAGTIDLEKLLPKILETMFGIFPQADRGCILLRDDRTGNLVPRAVRHRRDEEDASIRLSRTIVKQVMEQKKAILSADAASDDRFKSSESISSLTIHSMMCAPLLNLNGDPIGLINMDSQNPLAQFRKDDLEILVAVAGQAALSYEGARLLTSYVEKQKQDNEMNIARSVQHALLPEHLPTVPGYEFFAFYDAAQAVGGDYYDVISLPDGRIVLAFGDVAGKGVPASLVMSRISSVVRSTTEFVTDAAEAVNRINDHMCARAVEGRFVTFVLVIVDPKNHKLSLVNAGHMSPLIRHPDGTIEEFPQELSGLPIGVMEGYAFDVAERDIAPGETIVIFTDGVSEAMNPENDLYSLERLRDFVSKNSADPTKLGKAIRADVKRFANGQPPNDDITLMVFGRCQ